MSAENLLSCDACGTREGNIASRSRACGCTLCQRCDRAHLHDARQLVTVPMRGIYK